MMLRSIPRSRAAGASLVVALTLLAVPAAAQTSLTLYNDGRVLVRRDFPLDLRRGEGQYSVPLGQVDPGSVFPLDADVQITNGRYDAGTDYESVLRRAVGRRLAFRNGKDTVWAEIAGVDPVRYKLADGSITFSAPGTPHFPAELVTLEPQFNFTAMSAQARRSLRLGYFTDGGGWSASYQAVLDAAGTRARLTGSAVVHGGPLRIPNAELQLLAGQVNRVAPPMSPRREAMQVQAFEARAAAGLPSEQKVGEFHLYTLPGRHALEPGVVTTVGLFEPASAPAVRNFEVRGTIPWWGGLPQAGEEEEVPVTVTYTITRARQTPLGDRPLPGGVVRLFQPDSAGRLQLIGEAAIGHSPAGEDLRLETGTAFDITAKRVQTNYVTSRDTTGGRRRTIATADYRVTVTNAGDQPVTVDVIEARAGEWAIVSSSVKAEKLSSTRTRFRVPVPAKGETRLTYRVRVIW
jgi:hypothetical protein